MLKIGSIIMSIFTVIGLILPGLKYGFKPTAEIDCACENGEIGSYASGFLYGLATEGVPSSEMAESIDISSVSQKTFGGLQHPIGDVNDVAVNLKSCDYIVVYLQDCFDTWYYAHDEISSLRERGVYDWEKFLNDRFLPQVKTQVENISKTDYADRVVYCLYNECDNAIWFGNEDGEGNPQFDSIGRENFYKGWKKTYDLVKSVNPDAKIGGPGYYEYNIEKLTSFLDYCTSNGCVPDIMIYHELQEASSAFFEDHYEEYRENEEKYGIHLPIIVTEYGTMYECGSPGDMFDYVVAMEHTNVYGNVAFWRLSNNLCDTAADDNSPNANWWLYRWYADMEGAELKTKVIDVMHSDVANVVKYNRDRFHYVPLNVLSSLNENKDEITILAGGCDYESQIKLKNLKETKLGGEEVTVTVEAVYYKGLSGTVYAPTLISQYSKKVNNSMKIKLDCADSSSIYKITVSKGSVSEPYENENIPVRYEFEDGSRLGTAYTYDSAYATTGGIEGMVGGIEKTGDGVSLKFNVPENGKYNLDIVYGKANDGQSPDDRVSATALCAIDGNEEELNLPNTVKSEFTSCFTLTKELTAGEHEITFEHSEGTFVLDSMLVTKYEDKQEITVLYDSGRSRDGVTAFLAVAPSDGYYTLKSSSDTEFLLDGIPCKTDGDGVACVFLRRGLNYIEIKADTADCAVYTDSGDGAKYTVKCTDMTLSDGAAINEIGETKYVNGISSNAGKAEFVFNAEAEGYYRMTFTYSNNHEGGVHDYNVDLIECYTTAEINGDKQNVWFRNTQSDENFKTVTANVYLEKGENKITLTNNGESKFNGMEAFAPNISEITFSKAQK